jgi:uncharacterized protein
MKFLLVIAVVVLVLWLARGARGPAVRQRREAPRGKPPALEEMVRCAHCGVHLPRSEALPGRGGLFCGSAHRTEHEREHAAP